MSPQLIQFADFTLDPANRTLERAGRRIELGGRYLDALVLLVSEPGRLIAKDRFMDEVWNGVPVTDEALTQAIRALRKALDDHANAPRFIETVPRHGYRFIGSPGPVPFSERPTSPPATRLGRAAIACAAAGAIVGFSYGAAGAGSGGAALSSVLVLGIVCAACAAVAGTGIALGIVLAQRVGLRDAAGTIGGAALAGLIVGAVGELLGRDGFALLTGAAPADITGAVEGAVLGFAAGTAIAAARHLSGKAGVLLTAMLGSVTGFVVVAAGGRMMAGSLLALAAAFPQARFTATLYDGLPIAALGAFEGSLFLLALLGAFRTARA